MTMLKSAVYAYDFQKRCQDSSLAFEAQPMKKST